MPERLSHVGAVDTGRIVELGRYGSPPCLENEGWKGTNCQAIMTTIVKNARSGLPSQFRLRKCMWA